MPTTTNEELNEETRSAWNANAAVWDAKMGNEGNAFVNVLQWPVIRPLLNVQPGQHILEIACGNGLYSRRLAALGAQVTAFDFSSELIKLAEGRGGKNIDYCVLDATDESALQALGDHTYDSALCNMGLFDIADIGPIFRTLPRLLKPGGCFVFSLMHPAFNNSSCVHTAEEFDDQGEIKTLYSIKVSRYMTPYHARGLALFDQPKPQVYFERPLEYYFKLGFANGFIVDGFEERAFPPELPNSNPLAWGGQFNEIPPVVVMRMRLTVS